MAEFKVNWPRLRKIESLEHPHLMKELDISLTWLIVDILSDEISDKLDL